MPGPLTENLKGAGDLPTGAGGVVAYHSTVYSTNLPSRVLKRQDDNLPVFLLASSTL